MTAGVAVTLNNIGAVFNNLGEKQKALEFYNQSLPLSRAVGDDHDQPRTLNNIGLVYDASEKSKKHSNFTTKLCPYGVLWAIALVLRLHLITSVSLTTL